MNLLYFLVVQLFLVLNKCWVPKIIWTYWQEEIRQGQFMQMFHKNHLNYTKGWDLKFLNKYTVNNYLNKIPDYNDQINKFEFTVPAHKANYIRILLLKHYGGVWFDKSMILTESFDWLLIENLNKDPNVLNKYGQEPEVFFFSFYLHEPNDTYFNQKQHMKYILYPNYQIWFIASKPGAKFITQLFDIYHQGFLRTKVLYQHDPQNNYIDKLLIKNNITLIKTFHYILVQQIIQYMLQMKQRQLDRQLKQIIINERQVAPQYYKIWHINSQAGPYSVFTKLQSYQAAYLAKYSKKFLEEQMGVTFKYMIKLFNPDREKMKFFFSQQLKQFYYINELRWLMNKDIDQLFFYFCPQKYKVQQGSYVHQQLIKPFPEYFHGQILQSTDPINLICYRMQWFITKTINYQLAMVGIIIFLVFYFCCFPLLKNKLKQFKHNKQQIKDIPQEEDQFIENQTQR